MGYSTERNHVTITKYIQQYKKILKQLLHDLGSWVNNDQFMRVQSTISGTIEDLKSNASVVRFGEKHYIFKSKNMTFFKKHNIYLTSNQILIEYLSVIDYLEKQAPIWKSLTDNYGDSELKHFIRFCGFDKLDNQFKQIIIDMGCFTPRSGTKTQLCYKSLIPMFQSKDIVNVVCFSGSINKSSKNVPTIALDEKNTKPLCVLWKRSDLLCRKIAGEKETLFFHNINGRRISNDTLLRCIKKSISFLFGVYMTCRLKRFWLGAYIYEIYGSIPSLFQLYSLFFNHGDKVGKKYYSLLEKDDFWNKTIGVMESALIQSKDPIKKLQNDEKAVPLIKSTTIESLIQKNEEEQEKELDDLFEFNP